MDNSLHTAHMYFNPQHTMYITAYPSTNTTIPILYSTPHLGIKSAFHSPPSNQREKRVTKPPQPTVFQTIANILRFEQLSYATQPKTFIFQIKELLLH